jgi:hypothetical protein
MRSPLEPPAPAETRLGAIRIEGALECSDAEGASGIAGCCHHDHCETARADGTYRRVLWAVLAINAVMFGVEGTAGILSGSVALSADALDFLGDAANYGVACMRSGRRRTGARARLAHVGAAQNPPEPRNVSYFASHQSQMLRATTLIAVI